MSKGLIKYWSWGISSLTFFPYNNTFKNVWCIVCLNPHNLRSLRYGKFWDGVPYFAAFSRAYPYTEGAELLVKLL